MKRDWSKLPVWAQDDFRRVSDRLKQIECARAEEQALRHSGTNVTWGYPHDPTLSSGELPKNVPVRFHLPGGDIHHSVICGIQGGALKIHSSAGALVVRPLSSNRVEIIIEQ